MSDVSYEDASRMLATCPQEVVRVGLVEFGKWHDTRTNGQHYTTADRRPTNQVRAWQTERGSRPTRPTPATSSQHATSGVSTRIGHEETAPSHRGLSAHLSTMCVATRQADEGALTRAAESRGQLATMMFALADKTSNSQCSKSRRRRRRHRPSRSIL